MYINWNIPAVLSRESLSALPSSTTWLTVAVLYDNHCPPYRRAKLV